MVTIEPILLFAAILVLLGVLSSKISNRASVPVLVLFLVLGMLAGSEGVGRIEFENYELAHAIGTLALALILFDGGLRTPMDAVRTVGKPAVLLATVGVLITALTTGAAAAWILGLPLLYGLLLGSIVSSTDAAAVFSILRGQGVGLDERLATTLEVESGTNDPMAIFLTVGFIQLITGDLEPGISVFGFFVVQLVMGAGVGLAVGWIGVGLVNRINLDAAGLYPILVSTVGVISFAVTAILGGSGFLAVYLTGLVLGNRELVFRRGIFLFHDGAAWLAQITMFLALGLLSVPSSVFSRAGEGLLVAAALTFVARPVAVFALLPAFRFRLRELLLVSWVGLKGAVPIILAIYPLLFGLPNGQLLFEVVFFVVLVSVLVQGWTLPMAAGRLGLQKAPLPTFPVTLDITSLRHVDADIVEYAIGPDSRAAGRRLKDLPLPEGAVVAMVGREHRAVPPSGSTWLKPDDYVFVVLNRELRTMVDRVFSPAPGLAREPERLVEFPLPASTTVGELEEFYGIKLDADSGQSLGRLIEESLDGVPLPGDYIEKEGCVLVVREVGKDGVEHVGIELMVDEER